MSDPRRDRVVVVFGGESECGLSHCPMHAHGPYTQAEAEAAANRMPAWMQPHVLTVQPEDTCMGADHVYRTWDEAMSDPNLNLSKPWHLTPGADLPHGVIRVPASDEPAHEWPNGWTEIGATEDKDGAAQ